MLSLNDICFEQIKENYYYGLFGDFKLIIDTILGYFNATHLCKQAGRKFYKWLENKQSHEFMDYIKANKPQSNEEIFKRYIGGGNKIDMLLRGTYVSKDFINNIACWISPEFAIKVNEIVVNYYANEYNNIYKNDIAKLNYQLKETESKLKELKLINEKYENVKEDITPKTLNIDKHHSFILIKKNKPDSKHSYYVMRIQKCNRNKHLKRLKQRYPHLQIPLEFKYNPNSINLFNRIKETFNDIHVKFNGIKLLNDYREENFITDIKNLVNLKFE